MKGRTEGRRGQRRTDDRGDDEAGGSQARTRRHGRGRREKEKGEAVA